ncbi:MAG: hypothetical protein A2W22_01050 [Candidatus Levybacteria bacterium RBG_16_35_11]|nr:MAG: hypothetical protein A2W22_01050 [Candidatus Levybacteria bacterium RBG_16_35_11]
MGKKRTQTNLINKIIELRSTGYSVPEISKLTGIPKTTVFRYARNVKVLPQFIQLLISKRGGSLFKKTEKENKAIEEAREIFKVLTYREKLLIISSLYWAEGNKKDFSLSNTDPMLIKVFISLLRDTFKIDDDKFRISVRIYEDLDKNECVNFWAKVTNIPADKFIGVNVLSGKKKGKLKYGMCRLRVAKGGDILKKVVGINKIIQEISQVSL